MFSETLSKAITDENERLAYKRMADEPLPLLSTYYYKAEVVDGQSSEFKNPLPFMTNGYRSAAIPGRNFNLSVFKGRHPEDLRRARGPIGEDNTKAWYSDYYECSDAVRELNKIGVRAFLCKHRIVRKLSEETKDIMDQIQITVPNIILETTASGGVREVQDYEGAVTFLAHLLHKNYLQEKDIPVVEAVEAGEPGKLGTQPFTRTMLEQAKSLRYQNKVRAGLGEPLLPETRDHPR